MKKLCWVFFFFFLFSFIFAASGEEWTPGEELAWDEILISGGADNEELARGYVNSILYPTKKTGLLKAPIRTGLSLEGVDYSLYQALRPLISQVAAGTLTSTVFSIPAAEVYPQCLFTAEELGVEAIRDEEGVTPEASAAITEKIKAFSARDIIQSLLADCPFELYWYNKATGGGCRIKYPSYSYTTSRITITGSVVFSMTVSEDYAAGQYEVDPAYGQGVSDARENAVSIVNDYESLGDYERLLAYKNEICALTSYNHEAADGGAPYGNPWQVVWVFDGDPDTNVVCEGYAKAFQYLNDLSQSAVTVLSPQGTMNGTNHMWNIVEMEDGFRYLADITNCDTGMAGYPDKLFLAGYATDEMPGGYCFKAGGATLNYVYRSGVYSPSQLKIAAWSYLSGGPPAPVFTLESTDILLRQPMVFSWTPSDFPYDALTAEITYTSPEGTEEQTVQIVAPTEENNWQIYLDAEKNGAYAVRFSGEKDGRTAWSDPVVFQPTVLMDLGTVDFTCVFPETAEAGASFTLTWPEYPEGVDSLSLCLVDENGAEQLREPLNAPAGTADIAWDALPGAYRLRMEADILPGYLYDEGTEKNIVLQPGTLLWSLRADGVLKKYFGTETTVEIPAAVDGQAVTALGGGLFRQTGVERVTVPEAIGTVLPGAFAGCASLSEVTIGPETAVSPGAFADCPGLTVCGFLNSSAQAAAEEAQTAFFALDAPDCVFSASLGYAGYSLAVRLDREADSLRILETGEEIPCAGPYALIPLTEAGERTLTIACVTDGRSTLAAEPFVLPVLALTGSVLSIPEGVEEIEAEAFRGTAASLIMLPDSLRSIGPWAFADSAALLAVEMGAPDVDETAFANCPQLIFCVRENWQNRFQGNAPFLAAPLNEQTTGDEEE